MSGNSLDRWWRWCYLATLVASLPACQEHPNAVLEQVLLAQMSLTLSVEDQGSCCPLPAIFVCRLSVADSGSSEALLERFEARWDFDGDGNWDTGWVAATLPQWREVAYPLEQQLIVVSEVRSRASRMRTKVTAVSEMPTIQHPDLIAMELWTYASDGAPYPGVTPIMPGAAITITIWYHCSERERTEYHDVEFYLNGVLVGQRSGVCSPSWAGPCVGVSHQAVAPLEPGTHIASARIDPIDAISEVNESNNSVESGFLVESEQQ